MKGYYFVILGLAVVTLLFFYCLLNFFNFKTHKVTTRQVTKDAILIALLCITGMFSIPMGENIKVSLQFLFLIIILSLTDSLFDAILIPILYLVLGLVAPFYAGFISGITPTFGFVISFVFGSIPFYFLSRYLPIPYIFRYIIASLVALLIVYFGGTLFFMFYTSQSIEKSLLITVVPYIGFDIAKIAIGYLILRLLPKEMKPILNR